MQDRLAMGAVDYIRAVTDFIFVEQQPEKADVIFVPGSHRIENCLRAAELYNAGYAPYVLPSGRYSIGVGHFLPLEEPQRSEYPGDFQTEWELYRTVLMKHGVPDSAILREDMATYTWENAQFSRDVMKNTGLPCGTAILCSRGFHARRALHYYQTAMPETRFIVCPSSQPGCGRDEWYKNEQGRKLVLQEVEWMGNNTKWSFEMLLKSAEKEG